MNELKWLLWNAQEEAEVDGILYDNQRAAELEARKLLETDYELFLNVEVIPTMFH